MYTHTWRNFPLAARNLYFAARLRDNVHCEAGIRRFFLYVCTCVCVCMYVYMQDNVHCESGKRRFFLYVCNRHVPNALVNMYAYIMFTVKRINVPFSCLFVHVYVCVCMQDNVQYEAYIYAYIHSHACMHACIHIHVHKHIHATYASHVLKVSD